MLSRPKPNPKPLERVSPTVANELFTCPYRVAWRRDDRFRALRRPTPYTELGAIAHATVEDVSHGALVGVTTDEEARSLLEEAWAQHLAASVERLRAQWAPADPPPADEWPGYHV